MRQLRSEAEKAGIRLDFVLGKMETRSRSGRVSTSSGIFQFDADGTPHVFIQADSKAYSPQQLFDHELFHSIVAANKGLWQDMVDYLYQTHTQEEIARMVDAYVQAYDGCYGTEEADAEKYLEEIFADVYAEMQRGGGQQRAARELAGETAQRFAGDIENARQNRAGIENRNGPGTRFTFSEEEAQEMLEEGVTVSSGPSALNQKADKKPVSQVLAESVKELENMQPLAHLTGQEMNDRSKTLDRQIREWFASFGNVVSREGFGDILFQEYGVGGVMNHKPLNRAKLVTLIAAKDVVLHGKVISYEENHKGRGYPSYIFAGPVTVGPQNTKIYVAAVVDVRSGNKFYFNECVDSAGNYVRINEGTQGNTKTGVTVQDGITRRPSEPSIDSIAEGEQGVKKNPEESIDWNGNREEPEVRRSAADKESYQWSELRGRVAEMTVRQRKNLVAEAAELNEATWREEGLGIKPYSGSLNDTEAIVKYVDDAVEAVRSEPGSAEYDPSFDIETSAADEGSDTRLSAADEDDDSLGVDWIGSREEGETNPSTTAPEAQRSPSPASRGGLTEENGSEAARASNEGNSGQAARNDRTERTDVPSSGTAESVTPFPQVEGSVGVAGAGQQQCGRGQGSKTDGAYQRRSRRCAVLL